MFFLPLARWSGSTCFAETDKKKPAEHLTTVKDAITNRFMNTIRSICVYCGSSPGNDGAYIEAGHALGRSLARSGLRLVYGGGTKGIMGAVAQGTLKAGGKVMGIIPRFLMNKEATETALGRLDQLVITENMHERKHRMFEESDAFVALPGGIGTVEEIVEIMTWAQLGHHRKPIVFANVNGFWDPMLALMDHMAAAGSSTPPTTSSRWWWKTRSGGGGRAGGKRRRRRAERRRFLRHRQDVGDEMQGGHGRRTQFRVRPPASTRNRSQAPPRSARRPRPARWRTARGRRARL